MAEFESLVDKLNKQKEYKPDIIEEETALIWFTEEWIPWVDKPRLQWEISVDWDNAWILNLQIQIDDLDARVTALENA